MLNKVKTGDLVRKLKQDPQEYESGERNVGIVVKVGTGVFKDQIKVMWTRPLWYDPDDGLSAEYPEELWIMSEA